MSPKLIHQTWMKGGKDVYILSITSQGIIRPEKVQHPTQKPVAVMEWCIEKSKAGNIIYDPFLGSGTTLIAAEKTNRICYGLEISPAYVDVIVNRWQIYTNQQATLEATGQTFDNVGAALAATIAAKAAPTREFEENG
jgi:DNA modification methylase